MKLNNPNAKKNLRPDAHKGHPGAGGRPPDWLKAKCQKIIEKRKLIDWLGDVAEGKNVERHIGIEGDVTLVPARAQDRLRAMEMLMERGWGKASQPIDHAGSIDINAEQAKKELEIGVTAYLAKKGIALVETD